MGHRRVRLVLIGLLMTAFVVQASAQSTRPILWGQDVAQFVDEDKVNPPSQHGILFIGSSIFRLWNSLKADMSPLPVSNRGFGGARSWELLHYMDQIVLPYKPAIIVYYAGSNDVDSGVGAREIADNFKKFTERVRTTLPDTRIFFVSINRAPQKRARWNVVDEANAFVEQYCVTSKNLGYINVNPALFDAAGNPRFELYVADELHFKPPAYAEFTKIIRPVVERAWEEASSGRSNHE